MQISQKVSNFLKTRLHCERLWVAYSGGLDSHVLLHSAVIASAAKQSSNDLDCFAALAMTVPVSLPVVHAIHIHHGLHPDADAWTQHCASICNDLSVPLEIIQVDAKAKPGESPEAAAREARYHAFSKIINKNEVLLLAHHQDDQAETVLLQLFRGAGVKGLAAMPQLIEWNNAYLARPLLDCTREDILQYAHENRLQWIEDDSNQNQRFDRNYLRHQVMPLLKQRWPAVLTNMHRSAQHMTSAQALNDKLAEIDLAIMQGSIDDTLSCEKLLQLDTLRQENVLRYWISQHGFQLPSTKKLTQVIRTVLYSQLDASPIVDWPSVEIRRYGDDVYAIPPLLPIDPNWQVEWDLKTSLTLPANLGVLDPEKIIESCVFILTPQTVTLRFRRGGERIRITKEGRSQVLKTLFQTWRIPPWERERIPLVFCGEELVLLVGYPRNDFGRTNIPNCSETEQ